MNTDKILVFKLTEDNSFKNIPNQKDILHFIADLRGVDKKVLSKIKEKLVNFGNEVYNQKGSFVVVSDILFDETETLNITPTIQEAYDFIEMEDIERQLNFN